jgi:hypothetical protein
MKTGDCSVGVCGYAERAVIQREHEPHRSYRRWEGEAPAEPLHLTMRLGGSLALPIWKLFLLTRGLRAESHIQLLDCTNATDAVGRQLMALGFA